MTRTSRASAVAYWLVLAAALAFPTSASAVTVADPQLQEWADHSYLPTPDEQVEVLPAICPTDEATACTWPGGPIYLGPGPERRTRFLHELGHRFDYALMDDTDRAAFAAIYGETRPWRCGCSNSPHELFATAYAQLARARRPEPSYWWEPMKTILEHRTEVRSLIRSAARN